MYTRIRLCHNHHPETAGEDGDYLVVRPSDGEDSFPQAGLHPDREPGAGWKDGLPLTDRADAARTREESRGVADAQAEMLLAIAFSKLMFGRQNGEGSCIHVPSHMRRWDARIDDVSSADHDQFLAANREALAVAMADHARRETPSHMTVFDDRPLHEPSDGCDNAGDEPVIELREARIGEARAPCHAVTLRRSAKLGIRECVEAIDRFAELAGTNGGRLGDRRRTVVIVADPETPTATTAAAAAVAAGKATAGTTVLLGPPKERTAKYLYSRSGGDPAERTGEAQPYQVGGPISRHTV